MTEIFPSLVHIFRFLSACFAALNMQLIRSYVGFPWYPIINLIKKIIFKSYSYFAHSSLPTVYGFI